MLNDKNYKVFKDEDGRIMVQFKRMNENGEIAELEPEVLFDENHILNEEVYQKAIKERRVSYLQKQLQKLSKENKVETPEEEISAPVEEGISVVGTVEDNQPEVVGTVEELPTNIEVNKETPTWKKVLVVAGGIALVGAIAYFGSKAISNLANKDTDAKIESGATAGEDTKEDEVDYKVVVENTIVDLTVDDVEKIAYEVGKYLNEDLKLGISQNSINAVTFIMNQENGLDETETKALIDAGFIASDAADVFPATLETTNVINQNNALTTEDETRKVISYSIFAANKRDKELCDAFAFDIEENQKACAELNGGRKENETDEDYEARMTAARNKIWTKWESFETYGGLTQGETGLPYMVTQGSVASQWVALQQLQPYSTAYAKSGLGLSKEETKKMQERINFASGVGKDTSKVFVDFSTMYNLTNHNLGEACVVENETTKTLN